MVMSKQNLKCGKFDLDKDIEKVVCGIVYSNHIITLVLFIYFSGTSNRLVGEGLESEHSLFIIRFMIQEALIII